MRVVCACLGHWPQNKGDRAPRTCSRKGGREKQERRTSEKSKSYDYTLKSCRNSLPCLCLSVSLSVSQSLSVSLTLCLSVCLSLSVSVCLSHPLFPTSPLSPFVSASLSLSHTHTSARALAICFVPPTYRSSSCTPLRSLERFSLSLSPPPPLFRSLVHLRYLLSPSLLRRCATSSESRSSLSSCPSA